jgi:shikimate kinase
MYKNICLIGLPYAGKSTIGRHLSQIKNIGFIETDIMISNFCNNNLAAIIKKKGVNEFLNIESKIAECLHCENTIISTGGSMIYNDKAISHIKNNLKSRIVYLELSLPEFKYRINNIKERGVVNPNNLSIDNLYEERIKLCNKYADTIINTNNKINILDKLNF